MLTCSKTSGNNVLFREEVEGIVSSESLTVDLTQPPYPVKGRPVI
jgi:hypothetical protein